MQTSDDFFAGSGLCFANSLSPCLCASWSASLTQALSRTLRDLDNPADEEYQLVARRKAPHNQQIETDALRALLISGIMQSKLHDKYKMKFNVKLLNLKKRRKKYLSFVLDVEPKSKKATKNKSELQKTIIEKLRSRNWEGLKGKVAIEITAYSGQRNPPQIEKFVKNIVDIMHKKEILLNNEDKPYLPYKDDNCIKYLRAKYVFLEGDPSIHLKIRPFSSLISDIHFVRTELDSKYYTETSTRSNWEEYKELIDDKETYLKILSNAAYDSMLMWKTLDVQKKICDAMSIAPHIIGLLYPKESKYIKALGLKQTYRDWASMLLDVPIRIHLPGIPLKEGEDENYKSKYKADIRKQMTKYLADHQIFNEFQSPILITAFYMPPRKQTKNYKDIDNHYCPTVK